jgi:hypothetical protein
MAGRRVSRAPKLRRGGISRAAIVLLALMAGCVLRTASAVADKCAGHRNNVDGVDTTATDTFSTAALEINGCGNTVSNNTVGSSGQKLRIAGSDNDVEVRAAASVGLPSRAAACTCVRRPRTPRRRAVACLSRVLSMDTKRARV